MIKRFFVFFSIFIILFYSFSSYINSNAMEIAMDYGDFFFTPHIFYGLNNGIEYDLQDYVDNKEDFYKDIFVRLTGQIYDDADTDYYLNNSFYSYDFGYSNSELSRIENAYSQYIYNPQADVLMNWSTHDIANWNRYDNFYVKKYLESLNNYESVTTIPPLSENIEYVFRWPYSVYQATIGVDYSFTYSNTIFHAKFPAVLGRIGDNSGIVVGGSLISSGSIVSNNCTAFTGDINSFENIWTSHAVMILPDAFSIDNGVLNLTDKAFVYLTTGQVTVSQEIVLAPDVIRDPNTDEIIGNDIPVPAYDGLAFDVTALQNLIDDKISEGGTLTWDDIIDNGIIVDENGDAITNDDVDTRPISTIIDTELEYEYEYEDVIPPIPPMPNPKFKFDDIHFGEDPRPQALSVLARIVNVTQRGLPKPLIAMFWGICITLLLLGIVKILHK